MHLERQGRPKEDDIFVVILQLKAYAHNEEKNSQACTIRCCRDVHLLDFPVSWNNISIEDHGSIANTLTGRFDPCTRKIIPDLHVGFRRTFLAFELIRCISCPLFVS